MFKNEDLKIVFIIWMMMISSIFMYAILVVIQVQNSQFMTIEIDENSIYKILLPVVFLMSTITGTLSVFAKKFLLKEKYYSIVVKGNKTAKSIYTFASIAPFAFAETIAVFGLILFFIGKNQNIFFSLAFVSIVLILLNKPSIEEYETFKKEFEGKVE